MSDALTILPYDLPDAEMMRPEESGRRVCVYVPPRVLVVIGKGSDPELELEGGAILHDRVPVLRRATGGCAVVLTPGMVCVSFAVSGKAQEKSSEYFRVFNSMIIHALEQCGVSELVQGGISDIARHDRKIAGSALYRNRLLVFYHAVINLADDADLMERYLSHPPRTPDYRNGRNHREFVTSLAAEGFDVDPICFKGRAEAEFEMFPTELRTA